MSETVGIALDGSTLVLHALGAAVLALVGVLAARQAAPRAGAAGWVLGTATVAVGALALVGWWAVSTQPLVVDGLTYGGLGRVEAGPTSSYLVSVVAPALALLWALGRWYGPDEAHAGDGLGVGLQTAGVWVVTLPLQAALCAYDPSVPLVLLGAALAVAGAALVWRGHVDAGDVLAALGTWVVACASWPGAWSYASPVVVAVLVLVRRSRRAGLDGR